MASLKDLAVKRGEMFYFDPRSIEVDPDYNVRVDSPELRDANDELRGLIRANGFKQTHPLTVRLDGERVILVAGHRRLAQTLALIQEGVDIVIVPCIAEAKGTSAEDRDLDLLVSNSGLGLNQIEKGCVFKRLVAHGWEISRIATQAGISTKHVHNLLTLASAPKEIKTMIAEGELSSTTAILTLKAEGETKALEILTDAVADAKAQGKTKATAKTMAAPAKTKSTNAGSFLDSLLAADGVITPVEDEPTPTHTTQTRHGFTRPRMTPAKFQELWETLCEMTQVDDVAILHTMAGDVLK
jgi:ParB-like chromosome segregation protein Spo0J